MITTILKNKFRTSALAAMSLAAIGCGDANSVHDDETSFENPTATLEEALTRASVGGEFKLSKKAFAKLPKKKIKAKADLLDRIIEDADRANSEERPARPQRPVEGEDARPERPEAEENERPERPEAEENERPERPERPEPEDSERPERPEPEDSERPERPERPEAEENDRPERPEGGDSDRPERPERPDESEGSERPQPEVAGEYAQCRRRCGAFARRVHQRCLDVGGDFRRCARRAQLAMRRCMHQHCSDLDMSEDGADVDEPSDEADAEATDADEAGECNATCVDGAKARMRAFCSSDDGGVDRACADRVARGLRQCIEGCE